VKLVCANIETGFYVYNSRSREGSFSYLFLFFHIVKHAKVFQVQQS
jgi:hypothetical protein